MLNSEILSTLRGYTAGMQKKISFVLQAGEHEKRDELKDMLQSVATVSEQISFRETEAGDDLRSPVSFLLEADGADTGIRFSGIPGGHEFNSFVLALLQASGTPVKLDEGISRIVKGIEEDLNFEVFVSLSCHNCPDVVQTLNQFALLNPRITVDTIDGGLFPQLIEERDIQGVPCVYLNGEVFANGKIDPAVLVARLLERMPEGAVQPTNDEPAELQDITVIGGGPSGVAAAIYAARKGLKVTLIADRIGGQVKDTVDIENFISVPRTTGTELSNALAGHMGDYDIRLKEHLQVKRIENKDNKIIHLSSGEVIESRTLIIATGAKWRELGCPGEKENIGNGVAYCPHCDGPFFKGKDVAVIGGGNSGIEAALDLAGMVRNVTVLEFLPDLKADKVLVDKARSRENISIITNAATQKIEAENGKVNRLVYQDRASEEEKALPLSGVFVQIGLVPNSGFVADLVERNAMGEILVDEKCATSVPGIFACGDVTTVPYKQIVIAMGEGSKAALSAFDYLLKGD